MRLLMRVRPAPRHQRDADCVIEEGRIADRRSCGVVDLHGGVADKRRNRKGHREAVIAADLGAPALRPLAANEVEIVALHANGEPEPRQAIGNTGDSVALLGAQLPCAANAACAARRRCGEREDRHLINGERHILWGDLNAVEVGTADAEVADRLPRAVIWARRLFNGGTHAAKDLNDVAAGGVQRDAADRQVGVWMQARRHQPEGGRRWVARHLHLRDRSQLRLALHADGPGCRRPPARG